LYCFGSHGGTGLELPVVPSPLLLTLILFGLSLTVRSAEYLLLGIYSEHSKTSSSSSDEPKITVNSGISPINPLVSFSLCSTIKVPLWSKSSNKEFKYSLPWSITLRTSLLLSNLAAVSSPRMITKPFFRLDSATLRRFSFFVVASCFDFLIFFANIFVFLAFSLDFLQLNSLVSEINDNNKDVVLGFCC